MKQWNWKYIVIFILAIPVVNYLAGHLGKSAAQHVNERDAASLPSQNASLEIRVVVSSQDSEGVTQQNFDRDFLKYLEAYMVKRVKLKAKEFLASQGYPNSQLDISSEATYVESGPMKLAVIRLRSSDGSNQVFITGVIGNELKRITCVRNSIETIPISYGVCADKVKEVFGTKIGA